MATYHKCQRYRTETAAMKAATVASGAKDARTFAQAVRGIQAATVAESHLQQQQTFEAKVEAMKADVVRMVRDELLTRLVPMIIETVIEAIVPAVQLLLKEPGKAQVLLQSITGSMGEAVAQKLRLWAEPTANVTSFDFIAMDDSRNA
jgi:hypothetical protein